MWSPELNQRGLSQGDILVDVPVGVTKVPLTFLSKEPYEHKNGRVVYTRYDTLQPYPQDPATGHWLAKGQVMHALVIAHSCDLDDLQDTERVLVAPVWRATRVTSSDQDRKRIVDGLRPTYVGLPGVPGVGDCYADLRSICPLDRFLFSVASRHCSMTDDALAILRAQLALYLTRVKPQHLIDAIKAQIAEENKS